MTYSKRPGWNKALNSVTRMVLVLVIGDLHIPYRAHDIPAEFKALFQPGRFEYVIITGNMCSRDVYDYFRSFTSYVYAVAGEYDDPKKYPETQTIKIEDFTIGLCHGHQVVPWGDKEALALVQKKLGADILISGHTHKFAAYEHQNKFFLNPGTGTGAYSGLESEVTPSFVLMDIKGSTLSLYVYHATSSPTATKPEDKVRIHQLNYQKKEKDTKEKETEK